MAKVIMTIAPEDGMFFDDILSFKTESYIGIFDNFRDEFMVIRESHRYFEPSYIGGSYDNLKELDDAVFEECGEHITDVFDRTYYTLTLD